MEKSADLKSHPSSSSLLPSQEQIENLLTVMSDREQKLSDLATQQQRLILWRAQFVRLEREWNDVKHSTLLFLHLFASFRSKFSFTISKQN